MASIKNTGSIQRLRQRFGRRRTMRRPAVAVFLLAAVALAVACENPQAPVSCGPTSQQTINVGESTSVSVCFNDANGDVLSYSATSSNPSVATASAAGSSVTVTAVSPGSASITITARDPGGLQATAVANVTVPNRAPRAVGTIAALTVAGGETATVDVSGNFMEPDGQTLSYSASSSNPSVATATASGSTVTVTAVAKGTATVTVTAPTNAQARGSPDATITTSDGVLGNPVPVGALAPNAEITVTVPVEVPSGSNPGVFHVGMCVDPVAGETNTANNCSSAVMVTVAAGATRLTDNSAVDDEPEWSPDGARIAFSSEREGNNNSEVYVMNADGSGFPTRLTTNGEFDRIPLGRQTGPRSLSKAAPPSTS